MGSTPWRRRLNDLLQLIRQADQTYFEPNLFRLNINNAITTARTVTFLIQKSKETIPEYETLYQSKVLDVCKTNTLMKWLVDARNSIEKEGDLAVHSQLNVSVMYSYIDEGPMLNPPSEDLLFASQNRLWRSWLQIAPKFVVDESAIVIDRRWVANSLPDYELTDALLRGFSILRSAVDAFDRAVGYVDLDVDYGPLPNFSSSARREYIKLSSGKVFSFHQARLRTTTDEEKRIREFTAKLFADGSRPTYANASLPLKERLMAFASMACKVFNQDGYHETMMFRLNSQGEVLDSNGVTFADRVEKYIFWHSMADHARIEPEFQGIIFIGEQWFRRAPVGTTIASISDLPIVGEGISVTAATSIGEYEDIHIHIRRDGDKATADLSDVEDLGDTVPNFLYPLRTAWGLPNPEP